MTTFSLARTVRQTRHPASRGKSHIKDKREGEKRRKTQWVATNAADPVQSQRSFAALGAHEHTFNGKQWVRCQGPEEFGDYLEREAAARSYYIGCTSRKGARVTMKRRVKAPIVILTTTFPPWLADWCAAQLAAGRDPRKQLAQIRNLWLQVAQTELDGQLYLVGYAFHCDTPGAPHFDLCGSRQDGRGGRIGKAGFRLVGPWCVGTERQVRAGAQINSAKQDQLRRSIANFRHRYGADAKPLDVVLARALDHAAEQVLGAELKPFMDAYAARVPDLERQHLEAQMQALDNAKGKLAEQVASLPASPRGPEVSPAQPMPSRSIS